jgi:cytochrome c oxidase subunit 2
MLGCSTPLDMFSNATATAERVSTLTRLLIVASGIIFVGITVTMMAAVARRREPRPVELDERGDAWVLWGGVVLPVVVLGAVSVFAFRVMRLSVSGTPEMTIHVTGHQWWWQLDYDVPGAREQIRAANEIHVPVGRRVQLLLTSADVIHSFWVPRLEGKMDLIPGDTNRLTLDVRQPGRYDGACAEYCGTQHAHMAITVVADDTASFDAWLGAQRRTASSPRDAVELAGEQLFLASACATCHTVRGTSAHADVGPDLTHVGSRLMIAAGARPNSLANLEGWIANPQALKPGAAMPTLDTYTGPELRALAAYVASLK